MDEARLTALVHGVLPANAADPARVRAHLDRLTKPPGSLGRVEDLAVRLARVYGDPPPPLRRREIFLLAADHGVAARGVSAYPSAVTAQMCHNLAAGGAAINAITSAVDARLTIMDIGVDADLREVGGVLHAKVRRGTRDLSREAAMTATEVVRAIEIGARSVEARIEHLDVVGLGEIGIGNTTSASALTAALTGHPPEALVGPGTGISDARLALKRRIVSEAVRRLPPDADPLAALAQVGGLEIAGLVGVVLGAARGRRAIVLDGFIATVAAMVAVLLCPHVRDYLIAAHRSTEPGHRILLERLDLTPLLELDLRLGEGTGAALAFPLLEAAAAVLREMATFDGAGISGPDAPGPEVSVR